MGLPTNDNVKCFFRDIYYKMIAPSLITEFLHCIRSLPPSDSDHNDLDVRQQLTAYVSLSHQWGKFWFGQK